MNVTLPEGLLGSLALARRGGPFAMLLRHADRVEIPKGELGGHAALTEVGVLRTRALARHPVFETHPIRWCESSPVSRCMETGRLAGLVPAPSALLGDPGVFVTDAEAAGRAFLSLGTEHVVRAHLDGGMRPFLRPPEEGARIVLSHVAAALKERGGVGLLLSHDTIVMPIIAWLTGDRFEGEWLAPLDGIVIGLTSEGGCAVSWKGRVFGGVS